MLPTDLPHATYIRAIDLLAVPATAGVLLIMCHDGAQNARHPVRSRFLKETAVPMMRGAMVTFLAANIFTFFAHIPKIPRQIPYHHPIVVRSDWLAALFDFSLIVTLAITYGTAFQQAVVGIALIGILTTVYALWVTS